VTSKPQGYFTRIVRKVLEPLWEREYMKLGKVDRWASRDSGWERVQEDVGFGLILDFAHKSYNASEGQVLKSNQTSFAKAIKTARHTLTAQGDLDLSKSLPTRIQGEVSSELHPIRDIFLRRPGADKNFSELIKVRDVDFDVIYDMVAVRDTKRQESVFSQEDYEFMDTVRRALKATNKQTMAQVFNLDIKRKSA
jgi:hypothetical protein